MSFNENAGLDTSQVSSGGGRGKMVIGGGAGLVILVLGLVFGVDTSGLLGSSDPSEPSGASTIGARCRTGADANRDVECRVVGTVNSVQAFWAQALPTYGTEYSPAQTVLYSGQTASACGTASNAVGPFYCPTDKQVYIDASFFDELTSRYGADDGALAQEYVVAHEYGHHIQDELGLLGAAQNDRQGADSGSVRVELMADCLAGVWAHGASTTTDRAGRTLLKPLTAQDIDSALSAAAAVGDDRIQQKAQGRVDPESWTHGSAAQRQTWFTTGYRTGNLKACNTLDAATL
ncbi:KPN_02809 family neutral zinc metallopeptidase [Angustibacter luteus]|uniref:Neutral zinc metallopeptidase n=1 Tax=Angustibacter luteus TaxID=658456 RepID=A0ABW1JBG8_9ACTN